MNLNIILTHRHRLHHLTMKIYSFENVSHFMMLNDNDDCDEKQKNNDDNLLNITHDTPPQDRNKHDDIKEHMMCNKNDGDKESNIVIVPNISENKEHQILNEKDYGNQVIKEEEESKEEASNMKGDENDNINTIAIAATTAVVATAAIATIASSIQDEKEQDENKPFDESMASAEEATIEKNKDEIKSNNEESMMPCATIEKQPVHNPLMLNTFNASSIGESNNDETIGSNDDQH